MSANESAIRNSQSAIGHVTVEVVAWVTRFVGGDGTRRQVFLEPVAPGATVRSVLGQVSDRHPALQDALWDAAGRELSEHIEVLVNDAVLGLTHALDSPVRDGDRITLIGQYTGGAIDARPQIEIPEQPRREERPMASTRPNRRKLPREFYTRTDVLAVARDLLGQILVIPTASGDRVAGMIVETEAYRGPEDRASHAYGGRRTRRTETMYRTGGTAYVYFVYGMYHQFNVVTSVPDIPHAVLIRALEPVEGIELMRARRPGQPDVNLASGPGKLSLALAIDRSLDSADLLDDRVWIEREDRVLSISAIASGPRIGIAYAGEWAEKPWRFWLRGNPFVSRPDGVSRNARGGRKAAPDAASVMSMRRR